MGNLEYLMGRFREYYKTADIQLPPRFNMREYGFMFFDKKYVLRHLSFRKKKEMRLFLLDNVPKHAYYSTAYYQHPDNKSMEKKGWLGADLIFDLDADHIPETEGMSYQEMLGVVKREAQRLVNEFLLSDFGFDDDDITIAFSGGRGFHIYVRNDDVYTLKSDERREIVNYITGEGVNILSFIKKESYMYRRKTRVKYLLYPSDAGGWYGKVTREIMKNPKYLLDTYKKYDREALISEISAVLKDKKLANILVREMLKQSKENTTKLEMLARSKESSKLQILDDKARDVYLRYIKNKISISGETDEPVTTDIHRLIRLIGTLHGKTGFMVKQLSYSEFKSFEPSNPEDLINMVIPEVFKEGKSRIITNEEIKLPFDVATVNGEKCVPDYVAIFVVARRLGDFIAKCDN